MSVRVDGGFSLFSSLEAGVLQGAAWLKQAVDGVVETVTTPPAAVPNGTPADVTIDAMQPTPGQSAPPVYRAAIRSYIAEEAQAYQAKGLVQSLPARSQFSPYSGTPKGLALIFHGFSAGPVQYADYVQAFNDKGFDVFRVALPGHGARAAVAGKPGEFTVDTSLLPRESDGREWDTFTEKIYQLTKSAGDLRLLGLSAGGDVVTRMYENHADEDIIKAARVVSPFYSPAGTFESTPVPNKIVSGVLGFVHRWLPQVATAIGVTVGSTGGSAWGVLGGIVGREAGEFADHELDNYLGAQAYSLGSPQPLVPPKPPYDQKILASQQVDKPIDQGFDFCNLDNILALTDFGQEAVKDISRLRGKNFNIVYSEADERADPASMAAAASAAQVTPWVFPQAQNVPHAITWLDTWVARPDLKPLVGQIRDRLVDELTGSPSK